mgnify:CR=1 FL=1
MSLRAAAAAESTDVTPVAPGHPVVAVVVVTLINVVIFTLRVVDAAVTLVTVALLAALAVVAAVNVIVVVVVVARKDGSPASARQSPGTTRVQHRQTSRLTRSAKRPIASPEHLLLSLHLSLAPWLFVRALSLLRRSLVSRALRLVALPPSPPLALGFHVGRAEKNLPFAQRFDVSNKHWII